MMKPKVNAEQKQFMMKLMKEAGKGIVILIVAVMAFKFMAWNSWKLEQAADIAGEIRKEPPAVNLAILEKNSILFQKSFAHNENGNYYLINHFDITGYTNNIKITLNRREISSFLLFRFNRYNVLYTGDYYFIFMTADSGIEDLDRLDKTFPDIANVLFKLAVSGKDEKNEEKKEIIYQCFQGTEKELKYCSAKVAIPLPGLFKKGKLYEIVFEYKVTGNVKPEVMLGSVSNRHKLDRGGEGRYRKAGLLFSPRVDMEAPVLYLMGRGEEKVKKGRFDGTVSFKDISVYRYEKEYPWLKEFHGSRVAYFDFIDRLKAEFIGVKFFEK